MSDSSKRFSINKAPHGAFFLYEEFGDARDVAKDKQEKEID